MARARWPAGGRADAPRLRHAPHPRCVDARDGRHRGAGLRHRRRTLRHRPAVATRMSALSLHGLRILVVEDNFVLADALRYLLAGYDGVVTAIAPTVERALEAVEAEHVDVAVLDINLNGASVVPFAEHLGRAGIPFVFVTGYGDDPELL